MFLSKCMDMPQHCRDAVAYFYVICYYLFKKKDKEKKNMSKKYILFDLDGTLTDSNKKLSLANREAIMKAADRGVSVILASGRPVLGITHLAKELELDKIGGYILAYNGGNIIDCTNNELIYEKMMPAECIHTICEEAHKNGVIALTYTEREIVAEDDQDE